MAERTTHPSLRAVHAGAGGERRPSTFGGERARVAQLVALEAQLRPHTFGEEGRKQLHQGPEQPRQGLKENGRAREARKERVALFGSRR